MWANFVWHPHQHAVGDGKPDIERPASTYVPYLGHHATTPICRCVHRSECVCPLFDVMRCHLFVRVTDGPWSGLVPVMEVSSVNSDGFSELRAFLGKLAPPEPLEAMYKEARGKAAEVSTTELGSLPTWMTV